MTTCIKCGKPIPDGELFCQECSLNPKPAEGLLEELPQSRPLPPGQLTAPVKLPPQRKSPPKKQPPIQAKKSTRRHAFALSLACLIAVLALGFAGYEYLQIAKQRNLLRASQTQLSAQQQTSLDLQDQLAAVTTQLSSSNDRIQEQADQIQSLQDTIDQAQSAVTQSQYDVTAQQTELTQLTEQNDTLKKENQTLSDSVSTLTSANQSLSALNVTYAAKAKFLDTYVVFVENDGTKLYHKYDCPQFAKKSFWAYSRKLAESNGYTACPYCFG
jgi:hypothetical protein